MFSCTHRVSGEIMIATQGPTVSNNAVLELVTVVVRQYRLEGYMSLGLGLEYEVLTP